MDKPGQATRDGNGLLATMTRTLRILRVRNEEILRRAQVQELIPSETLSYEVSENNIHNLRF